MDCRAADRSRHPSLYFRLLDITAGEIHNSVLVAFGETATFAGALFESIINTNKINEP